MRRARLFCPRRIRQSRAAHGPSASTVGWRPAQMFVWVLTLTLVVMLGGGALAQDWPQPETVVPVPRPATLTYNAPRLCELISDAARDHAIPDAFMARLIWKESRFDIRAVSPVGAQGVAQFMPQTARIRGLANPFDPPSAISASAAFLADLRDQFGNLGLAAAAYNGGPTRVAKWLARGRGRLPAETEDYVLSITGRPADWFRDPARRVERKPLAEGKTFQEACADLPVVPTRASLATASAPWGVQIAAGISRRAASRAFYRARSRAASVIAGKAPIIVRSRRVAGRRLYSARVGAGSRSAARNLCARIRRIGVACVVRRN